MYHVNAFKRKSVGCLLAMFVLLGLAGCDNDSGPLTKACPAVFQAFGSLVINGGFTILMSPHSIGASETASGMGSETTVGALESYRAGDGTQMERIIRLVFSEADLETLDTDIDLATSSSKLTEGQPDFEDPKDSPIPGLPSTPFESTTVSGTARVTHYDVDAEGFISMEGTYDAVFEDEDTGETREVVEGRFTAPLVNLGCDVIAF